MSSATAGSEPALGEIKLKTVAHKGINAKKQLTAKAKIVKIDDASIELFQQKTSDVEIGKAYASDLQRLRSYAYHWKIAGRRQSKLENETRMDQARLSSCVSQRTNCPRTTPYGDNRKRVRMKSSPFTRHEQLPKAEVRSICYA